MNNREKAIDKLTLLIRRIAKNASTGSVKVNTINESGKSVSRSTDIDLSKKTIPTAVIEERCTEIIDDILHECTNIIRRELDSRMTAHIKTRHSTDYMKDVY